VTSLQEDRTTRRRPCDVTRH